MKNYYYVIKKAVVDIIRKNIIFYAKINKKIKIWKLEKLSRIKFFYLKSRFQKNGKKLNSF